MIIEDTWVYRIQCAQSFVNYIWW